MLNKIGQWLINNKLYKKLWSSTITKIDLYGGLGLIEEGVFVLIEREDHITIVIYHH